MDESIERTILLKLQHLPIVRQLEVLHFVEFLEMKVNKRTAMISELELAAESLLADYENDKELTVFTALDGEA
jgi:hypothetical protein